MKVCTRCKIEKDDSEFGLATSRYKDKVYKFLRSTCRKCDGELANIYYDKKKNDHDFIQKNRDRVNRYRNANMDEIKNRRKLPEYAKKHAALNLKHYHKVKDFISAKMKIKRQTVQYKKLMREYRKLNKDKIYQQEVVTKKRYHEKNRDIVSDRYCISQIKNQYGVSEDEITTDMIEIKRIQILIRRVKNNIAKAKKR